jgi:hypothetical protein
MRKRAFSETGGIRRGCSEGKQCRSGRCTNGFGDQDWTVAFAGKADRTDHRRCWQNLFKLHVVPPVVAKIIDVGHGMGQ